MVIWLQYTALIIFKSRKKMLERVRSLPFEKTHVSRRSDHTDYIKICVPEETDSMESSDGMARSAGQGEGQRFTFNSLPQDCIREDQEEDFCKVDYDELIQLRSKVEHLREENLRLVQENTENMELFNGYMKEMEQRVIDKKKEIDTLKERVKTAQDRAERNEERAKKAEQKLLNELTSRIVSRQDCGIQCQPKSYKWLNQQEGQRNSQKVIRVHGKQLQMQLIQKENQLMQREIKQLRQSQRNLAQSFQKEMRFKKAEQEYDSLRFQYYRTLANSPRPSISKSPSILPQTLKLQFNNSSSLNALISPRNNSHSKPPPYPSAIPPSRHHNILFGMQQKLERLISQSTCMEPALQFDRGDLRRVAKKGRV